jgi:hypothetical protein
MLAPVPNSSRPSGVTDATTQSLAGRCEP